MSDTVRNNPPPPPSPASGGGEGRGRFELDIDGHTAVAVYQLKPGVISFVHTEVPQELAGRGIGSKLVRGALELVRAQGLKVVAKCPFVAAYMGKRPEFNDLLL